MFFILTGCMANCGKTSASLLIKKKKSNGLQTGLDNTQAPDHNTKGGQAV